ncbi:MAG: tetratricopeptide repeat protein [Treponema sp.]|jgi:tetratricopeptide (TPR) repeat protein|nr:tetratricopeptide repeat protein [Treponema sp.]
MKAIALMCGILVLNGCDELAEIRKLIVPDYFFLNDQKEEFKTLFSLLEQEAVSTNEYFALVREIGNRYLKRKEYAKLVNFLNTRIQDADPFNAYYALMIAFAYKQQGALPVSALYFNLILNNYPDVFVQDSSIHLVCLNELIKIDTDPEQQIRYYLELIERFPNDIDQGIAYFMLGQAYEKSGAWNNAIQAYTNYLKYPGTIVPGQPDSDHYAKQLVDFNRSSKDWTFESLNSLVATIKAALDSGDSARLWQHRAKVNFFARSWTEANSDDSGMADFNMSYFMRGRISYTSALDSSSTAAEAYLRTWGWAQYSTWYLYFRKINFPLDPSIHGRWEWAGVYYGEKF